MTQQQHPQWQIIRDKKLADVASRIPSEWQISPSRLPPPTAANVLSLPWTSGVLTAEEIHITEDYDARELLNTLKSRKFTAVEVTTAFCKVGYPTSTRCSLTYLPSQLQLPADRWDWQRASIAHRVTNCITEPLFQLALDRASFLDDHLARTGQPLGPLHGLPISVKDTFHVAGYDSSIGIASLCFSPAAANAPLVQFLLDAGAVIHCKTNVPQTLLALDSVNNIFGRTLNPANRQQWTAGGSSGGEGVLVKMRGAVMGVGTDVGGSVRIPAMCNGIYGFKPSTGRVPIGGQGSAQLEAAGKVGMEFVVGPIARCLEDIGLFMRAVEWGKQWEKEASVIPGRWWSDCDGVERPKGEIVIGIVWRDGVTEPLPPVRRVLEDTVGMLKANKIEVVDVDSNRFKDCQGLANRFFNAEGGNHTFDILEKTGEPLIAWLATRLKRKTPATVDRLRDLQAQKIRLQDEFLKIWKTADGRSIDAFICPVAPHPVPPIDQWNGVSYTASFVLLDYPAAVIPVRSVRQEDLEEEMDAEVIGAWDKVNRELCKSKLYRDCRVSNF